MSLQIEKTIPTDVFQAIFREYGEIEAEYLELKRLHIELSFNNRLQTTAGRIFKVAEDVVDIELNPKYYERFGLERTLETFRHELAHAITYVTGGKFGHSQDFKRVCRKLGGSMNKKMASGDAPECGSSEYLKNPDKWMYKCTGCGATFKRKRQLSKKLRESGGCPDCRTPVRHFERHQLR